MERPNVIESSINAMEDDGWRVQSIIIGMGGMWVVYEGEILILDGEYGREVGGLLRKPSKWDVIVEHFTTLRDAIACVRELQDEEVKDETLGDQGKGLRGES